MHLGEFIATFYEYMNDSRYAETVSFYCATDRIPAERRLHPKRDLAAMLLIDRLQSGQPSKPKLAVRSAEHDLLYFECELDQIAKSATPDDVHDLVCYGVRLRDGALSLYV